MKRHRWIVRAITVLVVGFATVSVAPAAGPLPPRNDNYLLSLEINRAGTKLNSTDTIKDVEDTTNATTQTDIFDPPQNGGPAENTQCRGTTFGKTVWYDFYPDRNGTVRIRTSGYDNVIALYTFGKTLVPDNRFRCVHADSSPAEELDAKVERGKRYTIQVGSVAATGGSLQLLFDFFAAAPHRLSANSTLRAAATSTGIQILGLSVASSRTAKVRVSCGRFCRTKSKSGHTTETFPSLKSVKMPAGSALTIRVTAPNSIGVYIQYNVVRGNFNKITRCTNPGSRKPRRTCH